MFGHTIAVHLRAQLSHFELCMVFLKNWSTSMFQRLKGEGRSTYYDNHNSNNLVFQLRGVCFSFASFFFHFNSIIGRFTFTIFFKSLPEIHQSRQKQDLFKKLKLGLDSLIGLRKSISQTPCLGYFVQLAVLDALVYLKTMFKIQ